MGLRLMLLKYSLRHVIKLKFRLCIKNVSNGLAKVHFFANSTPVRVVVDHVHNLKNKKMNHSGILLTFNMQRVES